MAVYLSISALQTFECSRIGYLAIPKKARQTECWPSRLVENTVPPVLCEEKLEDMEALQTTMVGDMCQRWGNVGNLSGLLSSFCIFSDSLSSSYYAILHQRGMYVRRLNKSLGHLAGKF